MGNAYQQNYQTTSRIVKQINSCLWAAHIGFLRDEAVVGPVSAFHPFKFFAFTPFAIAMWMRQEPGSWVYPILETAVTGTARWLVQDP